MNYVGSLPQRVHIISLYLYTFTENTNDYMDSFMLSETITGGRGTQREVEGKDYKETFRNLSE